MLQFHYSNKTAVPFYGNAVLNFLGNEAIFVTIQEHQAWVKQFYESRNWYRFNPMIRMNFLTEEMGELSQVVRTIELGRDHPGEHKATPEELRNHLKEELCDVFDQTLILCSKYDLDPAEVFQYGEEKLKRRFDSKA